MWRVFVDMGRIFWEGSEVFVLLLDAAFLGAFNLGRVSGNSLCRLLGACHFFCELRMSCGASSEIWVYFVFGCRSIWSSREV